MLATPEDHTRSRDFFRPSSSEFAAGHNDVLSHILFSGGHTNPPHPHKSNLNQSNNFDLQWTSSVLCVSGKLLHLKTPNSNLLIRGGGGGVGLCGPGSQEIYACKNSKPPGSGRKRNTWSFESRPYWNLMFNMLCDVMWCDVMMYCSILYYNILLDPRIWGPTFQPLLGITYRWSYGTDKQSGTEMNRTKPVPSWFINIVIIIITTIIMLIIIIIIIIIISSSSSSSIIKCSWLLLLFWAREVLGMQRPLAAVSRRYPLV